LINVFDCTIKFCIVAVYRRNGYHTRTEAAASLAVFLTFWQVTTILHNKGTVISFIITGIVIPISCAKNTLLLTNQSFKTNEVYGIAEKMYTVIYEICDYLLDFLATCALNRNINFSNLFCQRINGRSRRRGSDLTLSQLSSVQNKHKLIPIKEDHALHFFVKQIYFIML